MSKKRKIMTEDIGEVVNSGDGLCTLRSVNLALEIMHVRRKMTKEMFYSAQYQLYQECTDDERASMVFGDPSPTNPSFAVEVIRKALDDNLGYDHDVSVTDLRQQMSFEQMMKTVMRGVGSRSGGCLLVDAELNNLWFPQEPSDADWRHMVLLYLPLNMMYEFVGKKRIEYEIVDTTKRGSLLPTFCNKLGTTAACGAIRGAPYFRYVHNIYSISVQRNREIVQTYK